MPKCCSIVFLLFLCVNCFSQNIKQQIEQIIELSSSYEDLEDILPIIRRYNEIYTYLPMGEPLKTKYRISSNYGTRFHPIKKVNKFHSGIDLSAKYGSDVNVTGNGKIIFCGNTKGYGKCVIVQHKYGFKTLYAHLTYYYTKKNKKVKKGDIIGFVGSTGQSTGNHLHYEIKKNEKPINPIYFIQIN